MPSTYTPIAEPRMAYHLDGTQVKYRDQSGNWSLDVMSAAGANMNDEDSTDSYGWTSTSVHTACMAFLFPELRDFTGYYWYRTASEMNGGFAYETSVDTTDGINGTWTPRGAWTPADYVTPGGPSTPGWRSPNILGSPLTGIKGLRFFWSTNTSNTRTHGAYALHLYGKKTTQDGLQFWHPTVDTVLPPANLDFGDLPVSTTQTITFRLKNNNSLQANGVVLDQVAMTSDMALTFSFGGGGYSAPLNIGNIAGGGTLSGVITARRIVPSIEAVGSRAVRISAVATSWS